MLVLGLERDDSYIGAPQGEDRVQAGDILVVYGESESLQRLGERRAGPEGDAAHEEGIEKFRNARRVDRG